MNCSLEKVLADAKSLVERLRNHDNAAEMLIEQTTSLNKRVEAMQQVKLARLMLPVGFSCPLLDLRIGFKNPTWVSPDSTRRRLTR